MSVNNYGSFPVYPIRAAISDDLGPLAPEIRRCFTGDPNIEHGTRLIGIRVLKVLAGLVGTAGPIAYIPMCNELAGDNRGLGAAFSVASIGSFGALNSWCLWKMIQLELESPPVSSEGSDERSYTNTALKIGAVVAGILSQIPSCYIAYTYNNHNIAYPALILLSESGYPIYSLLLTAEKIEKRVFSKTDNAKLVLSRNKLVSRLLNNMQALALLGQEERASYLLEMSRIRSTNSLTEEKITKSIGMIFRSLPVKEAVQEGYFRSIGRIIPLAAGVGLAGTRICLSALFGYKAMELFTDNPGVCYASGVCIALSSSYLTLKTMKGTALRTYETALQALTCSFVPNLSFHLQPKLTASLNVLGLGFAALSCAPSILVAEDNFNGKMQTTMEFAIPAGTILLVVNAMSDLINDVILHYTGARGAEEDKLLVEVYGNMERFVHALQKSTLLNYSLFLKLLPRDCLENCLEDAKMSLEDLENYIFRHSIV